MSTAQKKNRLVGLASPPEPSSDKPIVETEYSESRLPPTLSAGLPDI
jgi:hypothetical protein